MPVRNSMLMSVLAVFALYRCLLFPKLGRATSCVIIVESIAAATAATSSDSSSALVAEVPAANVASNRNIILKTFNLYFSPLLKSTVLQFFSFSFPLQEVCHKESMRSKPQKLRKRSQQVSTVCVAMWL